MRIPSSEVNIKFVNKYNEKAEAHSNEDSIYFYFNRAILIAQKIDYYEGEIRGYKGLAEFYEKDDKIYEKLRYALLLVRLYEKHGTPSEKADGYEKLGKIYFDEHLFEKAKEIFKRSSGLSGIDLTRKYTAHIWLSRCQLNSGEIDEALVTARKLEFEKSLSPYHKIELQKEKAIIYHKLGAFKEELDSYEKILGLISDNKPKFDYLKAATWNNVGYGSKFLDLTPKAKYAFYKTIRSASSKDDEMLGAAYYNLGIIFHNDKNLDSALICFNKAEKHYANVNDYEYVANTLNMMAMGYFHGNDQFNAQKVLDRVFIYEEDHDLPQQMARSYEIQTFVHKDLFEFELALESHMNYLSIRDSLLTEERSMESRMLFNQYQVEQIEKQLRLIWSKNELDLINLAREKAEKEAEQERFRRKEREAQLEIEKLKAEEATARQRLQALELQEERLNLENKEKELKLIQRDNALKELALEKERLVVSEKEKENKLLAQKAAMEEQMRRNDELEFNNKLRLVVGAFLFILLILIGILIAYRQLRKRKKHIEAQNIIIAESKLVIEKEKEISEGLLLNILPVKVAEELKANGVSKPKLYNDVSVGFTDFSGFTMISEKLTPEELVAKLDEIFLEFDKIIESHGLQRIKTIGDAYMYAAGLPDPLENHAKHIVESSIEMRDFIDSYNAALAPGVPKWNVRIGVNTGPVVAGVIGIKKFAYDIWGDTVNTAARMESSGEVGKVNISGSTYDLIKNEFKTERRGKVSAKNKGEIEMYFVEK